jgi:small subunit ribosomal protein S5
MEEEKKNTAPVAPAAETKTEAVKAEAPKAPEAPKAGANTHGRPGNRPFGQGGNRFGNGPRGQGGHGRFGGRRQSPEEKLYDEKVVKISRVAKVIKGGKRVRFTALVVIGDGKGKFGYGLGKSNEVPDAIKKALAAARRNMYVIKIAKNDTISHPIIGTFGATKVFLKPAPAGTGLIAGGAVRAILELAGIKNIFSKIYGSRTQTNAVRATVDGLGKLKTYADVMMVRHGIDVTKKAEEAPKAAAPETK